jgi:hypothetical protein
MAAQRAGLAIRGRVPWGESEFSPFRGLEYRPGSRLVMEFEKPARRAPARPLVSVLVPAYNPRFIEQALRSALAQTYEDLEILVFDDCRTPEIGDIANKLAPGDRRLVYEKNEHTLGGLDNYLKCFSRAKGEYVKFLNDDDILAPNVVERFVKVLTSEPDVTLVTSHRQCIDEKGSRLDDMPKARRLSAEDCVFDGLGLALSVLKYGNYVGEPTTTMFRREDAEWIRPHIMTFGSEMPRGFGDCAIWINLFGRGDCAYLSETLSSFRVHDGQRQRDPEIIAAAWQALQSMRMHARRLGFHEHASAPHVKVRSLGGDHWETQRFRFAPLLDEDRYGLRAWKRRAVRLKKRVTRRLGRT